MSKLETNTIDTVSGTTTLQIGSTNTGTITLGASGDTVTTPTGVTVSGSMSNTPAFRVLMTSQTSLANATATLLDFNSVQVDTHSAFNTTTHRFTVPTGCGGMYCISLHARFNSIPQDDNMQCRIHVNGALVSLNGQVEGGVAAATRYPHDTAIVNLSAGDYVETFAYQNSGSTITFGTTYAYFAGFKLIGT